MKGMWTSAKKKTIILSSVRQDIIFSFPKEVRADTVIQ